MVFFNEVYYLQLLKLLIIKSRKCLFAFFMGVAGDDTGHIMLLLNHRKHAKYCGALPK